MRTFDEWVKGNTIHGLAITITKSMHYELTVLRGCIHAPLGGHTKALDLCLKQILQAAIDFWESFLPLFTGFHNKLLAKVCEGGACSKALKSACWGISTGAFNLMLDKVCKVRVQVTRVCVLTSSGGQLALITRS